MEGKINIVKKYLYQENIYIKNNSTPQQTKFYQFLNYYKTIISLFKIQQKSCTKGFKYSSILRFCVKDTILAKRSISKCLNYL